MLKSPVHLSPQRDNKESSWSAIIARVTGKDPEDLKAEVEVDTRVAAEDVPVVEPQRPLVVMPGAKEDPDEARRLLYIKPATPAYNPHFPNTNQTKHCWSSYINYRQCTKLKGEGDEECARFLRAAHSLCPIEWLDEWQEAEEEGKFASPYDVKREH